jgi:hypothetical protein
MRMNKSAMLACASPFERAMQLKLTFAAERDVFAEGTTPPSAMLALAAWLRVRVSLRSSYRPQRIGGVEPLRRPLAPCRLSVVTS